MIDLKAEIDSKIPYLPQGDELVYRNEMRAQWTTDWQNHTNAYDFFQRKSLFDWMKMNEDDSYALYQLTKKSPWRNNVRLNTIPEKLDKMISLVADVNLQPEIRSFSMYGDEINELSEIIESFVEHAKEHDDAELKDVKKIKYLLTHGTLPVDCDWKIMQKKIKKITKENPVTGECEWTEGMSTDEGKIVTDIRPLNRIIISDVSQSDIQLQPRIWKKYVIPYAVAHALYHKYPNWKYVKPIFTITDEWIDTSSQIQIEDQKLQPKVVLLVRESTFENEHNIIANGVLMRKPGSPMPGKHVEPMYNVAWSVLYPFPADFAYGDSFVRRLHNISALYDFFHNATFDHVRQLLDPGIVTSYRNVVSRNMFAPGALTQVGKDFKIENLMAPIAGGFNAAKAELDFIQENIDKIASPNVERPKTGGVPTAYEIREMKAEMLRMSFNVLSAWGNHKRQETNLMIRQITQYYPTLGSGRIDSKISDLAGGIRKFFSQNGAIGDTEGERKIAFGEVKKDKAHEMAREIVNLTEKAKSKGKPQKYYILTPDLLKNAMHMVYVAINPNQRKSKEADSIDAKEFHTELINDPTGIINQEGAWKDYLRAKGKDPNKLMKSQAEMQPQQPQMPGQPMQQPGQPQQQEQKMRAMDQAIV